MEFQLNTDGFINNYLVSGRTETPFYSNVKGKDQLACEKQMRREIVECNERMPGGSVFAGAVSPLGMPWEYDYKYGNWFVDQSAFYPLLMKIELHAATVLIAPQDMTAEVFLWSYAAVDIWVNGIYSGGIDTPVYKPVSRKRLCLELKKGENLIYVRLQNLGVRDTRTLFAIQIVDEAKEQLKVTLPGIEYVKEQADAAEWLSGIMIRDGKLLFPSAALEKSYVVYDHRPIDFLKQSSRYTRQKLMGQREMLLRSDCPHFSVEVIARGQKLERSFERQELLSPEWSRAGTVEANKERVYQRIASVGQIPRGDKESFSMYPILARYFTGRIAPDDEQEIDKSLKQIESRRDCSDFLTGAIVRFMKLYPMNEGLAERCKEVLLNYRYWMDEPGNDGMCFWSENHSLLFFVTAYIAGDCYPQERFVRSGKTGAAMKAEARGRIHDWLESCVKEGFNEFHSGVYTPITLAAILNVVDFGDEELSVLAAKAADRLFYNLAIQTFKGVCIAPMGRAYRDVLFPYAQDIQSLVNLIDPEAPDRFSEWIIFLATSRYQIPEGLKQVMKTPAALVYGESNARICVEKTNDYILTSVESPRSGGSRIWNNIYEEEDAARGSFAYVKSLNERFHGTTKFEPGVFGYQQHMWYAALDPAAVIFVNHPGGSCEACSTRPGYWFGNGIMPALKQVKQVLYGIYRIPESHPIPFTHVYWPSSRFAEELTGHGWLAGKAGTGYLALWCSEPLRSCDDQIFDCEYRADSRDAAYVCVCAGQSDYHTLSEFVSACQKLAPIYDRQCGRLEAGGDGITYKEHINLTQYI